MIQVVQIRGRGEEVIWTKSKRTANFPREAFPICDEHKDNFEEKNGVWVKHRVFFNREFGFNFEIDKQSFG